MRHRHPWRARLRYRWDNLLARGTGAVIAWLGIFTLGLVLIAATVIQVAGISINGERPGFFEGVWQFMMRAMDAGTLGGDHGDAFRVVGFIVTIGGIFIVTALIGLVATGIDQKIGELRKGRSNVIETDHTLILGWSPKLFTILQELAVANESKKDACVVVMAPRDKVEMEDEIRARVGKLPTTRVVCRSGDPSDPGDIAIVDPLGASAVIVLQPDDEDAPDAAVVRSVLALLRVDPELEKLRIVAEFSDADKAAAISEVTGDKVLTVVSLDIIARITAQVCRQPGLSLVFQDLLDFEGAELYLVSEPKLAGRTFGEAVLSYETSSVIGIRRINGETLLAPAVDTVINDNDQIVLIAEDDSTVVFDGTAAVAPVLEAPAPRPVPDDPDRILVIGWNDLGPMILQELDGTVAPGSVADVLADPDLVSTRTDPRATELARLQVVRHDGDTGSQENVARLLRAHTYDHVIVLCYESLKPADADARTLVTLLQLHKLVPQLQAPDRAISIVSQLLDGRDVELARATSASDFVVSERLTSFVLAQLAEDPDRGTVFRDLFDSGGSDVSLQPATAYVEAGQEVTFAAIAQRALTLGEAAIGYRRAATDAGDAEIVVNPPKSQLVRLAAMDSVIVVSQVEQHVPAEAAVSA